MSKEILTRRRQKFSIAANVAPLERGGPGHGWTTILASTDQIRYALRPVASGRHQGTEEIQVERDFWKQILTDNLIVTQNSCKRVCFFWEETQKLSQIYCRGPSLLER